MPSRLPAGASAAPSAGGSGAVPGPAYEPRLRVAVATHGERTQALLRAYLSGPGRSTFVTAPPSDAQCLIADYDHAAARHELQRFRAQRQRPVIVLAMRNPSLPGTVWVPKPIDVDALAAAARRVRDLLAPAVEAAGTASVAPAAVQGVRLASAVAQRAPVRPGARPVALTPDGPPERAGPFHVPARPDWTGRIVWMALGVLGIAALTTALGWEPVGSGWRAPPPVPAMTGEAGSLPLKRAVDASLEEAFRAPPEARRRLDELLLEHRQAALQPAETRAWNLLALSQDTLTVSPYALPVALMSAAEPDSRRQQREAQLSAAVQRAWASQPRR